MRHSVGGAISPLQDAKIQPESSFVIKKIFIKWIQTKM